VVFHSWEVLNGIRRIRELLEGAFTSITVDRLLSELISKPYIRTENLCPTRRTLSPQVISPPPFASSHGVRSNHVRLQTGRISLPQTSRRPRSRQSDQSDSEIETFGQELRCVGLRCETHVCWESDALAESCIVSTLSLALSLFQS